MTRIVTTHYRYKRPPRKRKVVALATLISLLSRYDGDVERAIASLSPRRPITFEGQVFPHRKALAEYLAPRLHRPARSVERLLKCHNGDVEAVLLARPYRQRPRRVRRA